MINYFIFLLVNKEKFSILLEPISFGCPKLV
jgi:hypothetical protein